MGSLDLLGSVSIREKLMQLLNSSLKLSDHASGYCGGLEKLQKRTIAYHVEGLGQVRVASFVRSAIAVEF